jgi:hypothetical protein
MHGRYFMEKQNNLKIEKVFGLMKKTSTSLRMMEHKKVIRCVGSAGCGMQLPNNVHDMS